MRGDTYKQMYCIEEKNAALFELKMNEILKTVKNPEITLDRNRPFTAYIFYENSFDVPETITELFEMLSGQKHTCKECQYIKITDDKRKRRHLCGYYNKIVHQEQPACKTYYAQNFSSLLLTDLNDPQNK